MSSGQQRQAALLWAPDGTPAARLTQWVLFAVLNRSRHFNGDEGGASLGLPHCI